MKYFIKYLLLGATLFTPHILIAEGKVTGAVNAVKGKASGLLTPRNMLLASSVAANVGFIKSFFSDACKNLQEVDKACKAVNLKGGGSGPDSKPKTLQAKSKGKDEEFDGEGGDDQGQLAELNQAIAKFHENFWKNKPLQFAQYIKGTNSGTEFIGEFSYQCGIIKQINKCIEAKVTAFAKKNNHTVADINREQVLVTFITVPNEAKAEKTDKPKTGISVLNRFRGEGKKVIPAGDTPEEPTTSER